MELLVGLDRLLLIDCAVLCQARQLAVVQDTWDDALSNYSVAPVVDYRRRDVVQAIHLEHLQLSEAREVMVGLRPTRVLIRLCHVFKVIVGVNCVRKENQVIDEDLRFPLLSRIQRRDAALHDGCCSLGRSVQKVVVDLGYGSVSLSALGHVLLREILHNLVLLVPVANALGIEAEKWVDYLAELALRADRTHFLVIFFLESPMVHLQGRLSQEVLFGIQNLVHVDFQVLAELR